MLILNEDIINEVVDQTPVPEGEEDNLLSITLNALARLNDQSYFELVNALLLEFTDDVLGEDTIINEDGTSTNVYTKCAVFSNGEVVKGLYQPEPNNSFLEAIEKVSKDIGVLEENIAEVIYNFIEEIDILIKDNLMEELHLKEGENIYEMAWDTNDDYISIRVKLKSDDESTDSGDAG